MKISMFFAKLDFKESNFSRNKLMIDQLYINGCQFACLKMKKNGDFFFSELHTNTEYRAPKFAMAIPYQTKQNIFSFINGTECASRENVSKQ